VIKVEIRIIPSNGMYNNKDRYLAHPAELIVGAMGGCGTDIGIGAMNEDGGILATMVALLGADVDIDIGVDTTGAGVGCPHRPHSTIMSGLNVPISFDDIPKHS
jgi:Ni,Fe-hydrogenase III small subunit